MKYFITFFLIIFTFRCLDTQKNEFKSFNELAKSGYLEKGWIPFDFPKNTLNIKETHDLDTNKVWIECNFIGEFKFGNRVMKTLTNPEIRSYLTQYFKLKSEKLEYYSVGENEFIVIDFENKRLFYFRNKY